MKITEIYCKLADKRHNLTLYVGFVSFCTWMMEIIFDNSSIEICSTPTMLRSKSGKDLRNESCQRNLLARLCACVNCHVSIFDRDFSSSFHRL